MRRDGDFKVIQSFNLLEIFKGFFVIRDHLYLFDQKMRICCYVDSDVVQMRCPSCGVWVPVLNFDNDGIFDADCKDIDMNMYEGVMIEHGKIQAKML